VDNGGGRVWPDRSAFRFTSSGFARRGCMPCVAACQMNLF
jgi:hypothetical protein